MRLLLAAVLLVSTPAFAAGLASRPADDDPGSSSPMEGLYAAAGGGGALILLEAGNGWGYDAEARLGYSFNPGLQIYLSGAVDSASINSSTFRAEMFAAFVQYHLYARPGVGVYARAGLGVGLTGSLGPDNAVGLATAGGLGVEIGISPGLFLAPELFYKNATLNLPNNQGGVTENVIGLQLALIYY